MHKPLLKLLPAALAIALFSPLASAQTAATVNGKPITEAMVNVVAENMAKQSGQPVTPQLKDQIKKELILREVVVQEAEKQGLQNQKDVQDEIQINRQNILIRTLFGDYLKKHPITEAQIKAKYDQFAKTFGSTEYDAQHILVPTEKEAADIIAKLKKGEKFSELAKKYSKDTASAAHGGDLGWSTPGNYVEPFAAALTKLKPGEYTTTPVQTQFGWHIIKLDKTRPAKPPTLEQLKPQIVQELQREAVQKYQQELLAQAKVTQ
ncbi:MAG: peptidylprolyl isomerase [Betaproteobacteria bacterium]|jgi:peptidyl-prolyl cis-trans isomerase C|uniref:peptidylprolyl isomerase n=1 Tax=Thiomonas delicata TaxID=364030 RepID=A0A238D8N2_THIDL|nr:MULTISPECIES: peptidylprolyl isomerase [Thiomonas]MDE2130261.1 peptidylprolyl isomerase [Betaproteobacteria bacterium]SBP89688.1 putative parvulin-type peptidyl-prolyl cis-trans isomerase [Thiomonas delicata]